MIAQEYSFRALTLGPASKDASIHFRFREEREWDDIVTQATSKVNFGLQINKGSPIR
jgi:hypothetical protein